jgi:hypothetical protein
MKRELESDELVVWCERPIPKFFTPDSTGPFLFSLPWLALTSACIWVSLFGWNTSGTRRIELGAFLVSLPFVLIGVTMLLNPIFAYWSALRTLYVITTKRAIIFEGGWRTTIRSYTPDKLQDVYRSENSSGIGDLIFAIEGGADHTESRQRKWGFVRIRNVIDVERELKALARQVSESN